MVTNLTGFSIGKITHVKHWTDKEFSISVNANIGPYLAGQFTKLALPDDDGGWLRRAYSFVNSPNHALGPSHMEFLIINVPHGNLSTKIAKLHKGDSIYVGEKANGFMTLNEIPETARDLWLLSTGTAIGPFLSLLAEQHTYTRFENIILVHGVRTQPELVYQSLITELLRDYNGKLTYLPIVSRESHQGILTGRIPQRLKDGSLIKAANVTPNVNTSFFYLCGNPAMVHDTQTALVELGFKKHLRRSAGHFSFENYW